MGDKALPLSLTKVILENVTHIFRQMGFLLMILRSRQIDLHRVKLLCSKNFPLQTQPAHREAEQNTYVQAGEKEALTPSCTLGNAESFVEKQHLS